MKRQASPFSLTISFLFLLFLLDDSERLMIFPTSIDFGSPLAISPEHVDICEGSKKEQAQKNISHDQRVR